MLQNFRVNFATECDQRPLSMLCPPLPSLALSGTNSTALHEHVHRSNMKKHTHSQPSVLTSTGWRSNVGGEGVPQLMQLTDRSMVLCKALRRRAVGSSATTSLTRERGACFSQTVYIVRVHCTVSVIVPVSVQKRLEIIAGLDEGLFATVSTPALEARGGGGRSDVGWPQCPQLEPNAL